MATTSSTSRSRAALLGRYDYDYPQMLESGYLWPVVDARVKYVRPLLFNQALRVVARIVEWENRLKISMKSSMRKAARC